MISAAYIEFLAFCVGVYQYKRLKNSYMVWFIPLLAITFLAEVGSDYIYQVYKYPTYWIFNILTPLTTVFYGYVYYWLINDRTLKLPFLIAAVLYLLVDSYFLITATSFNTAPFLLSAIVLVTLSCYYFYRCMLDDVDLSTFYVKSGLWIASGILIFYTSICIVFSLFSYIRTHNLTINGTPLYNFVPRVLSIILYGCFIIAFMLWRKPQKT